MVSCVTVAAEDARHMIDVGVFGVSLRARLSDWPSAGPAWNAASWLAARPLQLYFKEHAVYN